MVRFMRAKHYTSCGPLCRPTPACTYIINQASLHPVTTIISPDLHQVLLYLVHTLPSVRTPRKLFQYFTRRISWFGGGGGNFIQRHPLNLRPSHMSLYCVLTFDPKWQPISQNHSTSRKIDTDSQENKRISMQSTVWEDTWVDWVIYCPSLSHSVKEYGQHPRPLPASPHPHP